MNEQLPAETLRAAVRHYYGEVLGSSADLRTNACCAPDALPPAIRAIVAELHPEVVERYYGCGSPIPAGLEGATVLDLGCGTGRDCYVVSKLVGPRGRVIGIDMTAAQLAIALRHRSWQAERFGMAESNVEFRLGDNADLAAAGIADASVDVVISNCVVNLAPDKGAVLREVFRVLKPGGELSFSTAALPRPMQLIRCCSVNAWPVPSMSKTSGVCWPASGVLMPGCVLAIRSSLMTRSLSNASAWSTSNPSPGAPSGCRWKIVARTTVRSPSTAAPCPAFPTASPWMIITCSKQVARCWSVATPPIWCPPHASPRISSCGETSRCITDCSTVLRPCDPGVRSRVAAAAERRASGPARYKTKGGLVAELRDQTALELTRAAGAIPERVLLADYSQQQGRKSMQQLAPAIQQAPAASARAGPPSRVVKASRRYMNVFMVNSLMDRMKCRTDRQTRSSGPSALQGRRTPDLNSTFTHHSPRLGPAGQGRGRAAPGEDLCRGHGRQTADTHRCAAMKLHGAVSIRRAAVMTCLQAGSLDRYRHEGTELQQHHHQGDEEGRLPEPEFQHACAEPSLRRKVPACITG
jgi:SAM-dependent methyltransferase